MSEALLVPPPPIRNAPDDRRDWRQVAYLVQLSRALDRMEEERLVPEKKVLYQFSARGHDMAQVMLGQRLDRRADATCGYYRSRPLLLSLGVDVEDALGSSMARAGGYSDGRDIGVVFNYPNRLGASALPMCGGVGAQYTPTAGWAQAIQYYRTVLGDPAYEDAIGVVLGGEASVATNGFWAALTIATTQCLPMLFYIEDNGYGISVPSTFQTPGGDIAANLASFKGLTILAGEGVDPAEASRLIDQAVDHVRSRRGPCLLRLRVPRLQGHSFQDTQTYKSKSTVEAEWARDPLPRLRDYLVPALLDETEWDALEERAAADAESARERAEARPVAKAETVVVGVFSEGVALQSMGGQWTHGYTPPAVDNTPRPTGQRLNMVTAIRRTLEQEMTANRRVVVFGEDVGPKGGVHAVTLGLQEKFGEARVFDTSLSEEGIVGRSNAEDAVGLLRGALRGNDPVIFFEHRAMLDDAWARRAWPGDDYVLPFGRAKRTREGDQITLVTWGAMTPRCEAAADGRSADVIDLRTLTPWDKEAVLDSVRRTRRCLIVHEDLKTAGFGAEIAAAVADEAFMDLDAPVSRLTMPDIPSPHNPVLLDWAVPSVERIRAKIDDLLAF